MAVLSAALVITLSALINRMAGGGWPVAALAGTPFRWLYGRVQCAAYIGLVALILHNWPVALAFGLGFLFWRLFGWGHLISLERESGATARPATGVDRFLVNSFGAHAGLFLRMAFVAPALIAGAFLGGPAWLPLLAIPFAALAMLSYELWWRVKPDPIGPAELTVGALWGGLIISASGA
jgi:hypothetical protein